MSLDIYLRNVYSLTLNFEDFNYEEMQKLAKNCCLISFKYYNWSELTNYSPVLTKKLYSPEFSKDEVIIYKRLDGKINEERYFSNAKNKQELKEVYKLFIQNKKKSEDNIEFINDFTRYVINGNIINYLNKDGKEFIERFDIREKNNIMSIKIREFFP